MKISSIIFFIVFLLAGSSSFSQDKKPVAIAADTIPATKPVIRLNRYDSATKAHSPRVAAIRSALIPGWGQVYNKKYWKVPIVYTALGITGYIFVDNIKTYKEYRFAYQARYKAALPVPGRDSTDYNTLKDLYKIISPESIKAARNKFRQYVDYSVLFFIAFWGLNVVDATVDAHLKSFDVSPDLTFHIRAGYSELARTSGVSLVLKIGK